MRSAGSQNDGITNQKKRATFGKALQEINALMELKANDALVEADRARDLDRNREKEETQKLTRKVREEREEQQAELKDKLQALRSKSAWGRVNAKLEALREDQASRAELRRRVISYKSSRADGRVEARNFIAENMARRPTQPDPHLTLISFHTDPAASSPRHAT